MTESTTPFPEPIEGFDPSTEPAPRRRMTHPVNVVHLVFGLIFLGVAASWALQAGDVVNPDANWFLPLVLIAAGVGGLVPVVVNAFRGSPDEEIR
jgi:hypothetical protein